MFGAVGAILDHEVTTMKIKANVIEQKDKQKPPGSLVKYLTAVTADLCFSCEKNKPFFCVSHHYLDFLLLRVKRIPNFLPVLL